MESSCFSCSYSQVFLFTVMLTFLKCCSMNCSTVPQLFSFVDSGLTVDLLGGQRQVSYTVISVMALSCHLFILFIYLFIYLSIYLSTFYFHSSSCTVTRESQQNFEKEMNYYNWCLFICNTFKFLFCLSLFLSPPPSFFFSFLPVQWEQRSCLHSSLLYSRQPAHN